MAGSKAGSVTLPQYYTVADPREGPAPPPPLFLDQTEARRAEIFFLETAPSLSKGLDDRPTFLSQIRFGTGTATCGLSLLLVLAGISSDLQLIRNGQVDEEQL